MSNNTLKFGTGNRKTKKLGKTLGKKVITFDLPAGWTCPGADICLSKAHPTTGKITDGPNTKFRCYAASIEAAFTASRRARWHNLNLLRDTSDILELLKKSIPSTYDIVRLHSSGDFFSEKYLQAWLDFASQNPQKTFYGYTKRPDLLINKDLPTNTFLVLSLGGKHDHLVSKVPLPSVSVISDPKKFDGMVFSVDEQSELHVLSGSKEDFAILVHGTQPKGWNGIE